MSRLAELLVLGLSFGVLYALMATSVTLVYQVSRVPNVAFVGIGTAAAVLHWDLTSAGGRIGDPDSALSWWAALGPTLLVAAVLGLVTHRLVGRLAGRVVPSLLLLFGWTAALLAGVNFIWGTGPKLLPPLWQGRALTAGDVVIRRQPLAALALGALILAVTLVVTRRTRIGLALRAAASANGPDTVVASDRLAMGAWVVSSVLASLAVILAAYPVLSNPYETTVYLPFAFGAALLGAFRSLPLAALGGLALGVIPTLLDPDDDLFRVGGARNLVALILITVLLVRRPWLTPAEPAARPGEQFPPVPRAAVMGRLQVPAWARRAGIAALVLALAVGVPAVSDTQALTAWTHGLSVFLVCASIVMVLGWSGDVPLGQVAFAGVGAYMASNLTTRLGIAHVLALPLAVAVAVVVALAVGLPALRAERSPKSRGMRLRLPTTVVSVAVMVVASSLLWGPNSHWFTGTSSRLERPDWMELFSDRPVVSYYLMCLALTAGVIWFAHNLRVSRVGRALAAAHDSARGARAVGIDPAHYRLTVLVFSAVVAALGGIVHGYLAGTVQPGRFAAFLSVQYLLYAVVGGVGSLAGVGVVVFAFEVAPALGDGTAGTGPGAVVLLGVLATAALRFAPGGLAALARRVAEAVPGLRPTPAPLPVAVTLPREEVDLDAW
jgi:branched-chain amino acid transport system permease protein